MKDSPRPMSSPVSARRKNRSSWTVRVASNSPGSPYRYVRSGHSTVSVPPVTPPRPERNAVFAHCVTMLLTPSTNRSVRAQRRLSRAFADAISREARHDGHALPPQFQRLPVNPGHHLRGHRRIPHEHPPDLRRVPGPAFERQRRVEANRAGLTRLHVRHQAARWRREGERVLDVDRHERRDVEGLGRRRAKRARRGIRPQPVVVGPAERVAHFREDDLQPLGGIEAVEEGDGVEAVAEIPQVRQQEDRDRPARRSRGAPRRPRAVSRSERAGSPRWSRSSKLAQFHRL